MYSDAKRIKQILFNLIGNAIKFTYKGKITLKLSCEVAEQKTIKFEVIDTGLGISPSDLTMLFQFFGKLQVSKDIN